MRRWRIGSWRQAGEHDAVGLRSAEAEALSALPNTEVREALNELSEDFRMVVYYSDVDGGSRTRILRRFWISLWAR